MKAQSKVRGDFRILKVRISDTEMTEDYGIKRLRLTLTSTLINPLLISFD
jgi:hypothetical protein